MISSQALARAYKALVFAHHLTATTRLVGQAILGHLNVHNGRCDPSEARIAAMLNITDRTVRKAKEELREAGYLSWKSHGGLHITADYRFNFKNLLAACDKIEQDASMLVGKRRRGSDRNNSSGMEEGVETGNLKPETGNFVP